MPAIVAITCPSCGRNVEISDDTECFYCRQCGAIHGVRPDHRSASVGTVVAGIEELGSDVRVAAVPALPRLKFELLDLEAQWARLRALRSVELENNDRTARWLGLVLVLVGLMLLMASLGPMLWDGGSPDSICLAASIPTMGLGIWLVTQSRARRAQRSQRISQIEDELQRLDHTIRQKRAELKRYQDLLVQ
jgi:predicted RNA-binding Zn-ribbon protein involved in translation (DUF1610 family)